MAAIVPASKAKAARSCSALLTSASASDTVSNAALVALCDGGALKSFLSADYADADELVEAFAAAGGILNVVNSGTGAVAVKFTVTASKPTLAVTAGGAAQVAAMRIALAWSASS
jgi:hypothetical protein